MKRHTNLNSDARGFSLLEFIVAMTVTLGLLSIASTVLSSGFNIRSKEQSVSDALADAQRGLNIMSREIANAGFNLTTNGIVPGDSTASSIRVRSNLNKYDTTANSASRNGVVDAGEDVKFFVSTVGGQYLVRHDANAANFQTTVMSNRLDQLRIHYYGQKVTYATGDCDISGASDAEVASQAARYIVIALCVRLPARGSPNTAGYQPASNVLLVSDVTLRNAALTTY
jgi:prepilin-type N-terminal cleavage/methylation domain-containing protein